MPWPFTKPMAVGGTRVVGSGMRVGRPAGGSSWSPRPAPPRSGSSRAGWWSATSATTSASPCPSPTRCCWPSPTMALPPPWRPSTPRRWAHLRLAGAPVRRRDARPLRRRPERGHGGRLRFPRLVDGAPGGPAGGRPAGVRPALARARDAGEHDPGRRRPLVDGGRPLVDRGRRRAGPDAARAGGGQADPGAGAQRAAPPLRGELRPQRLHRARRGAGPDAAGVCPARRVDRGAAGRPRVRPGEASRAVQWVAEQRTRGARTEAAAARAGSWDPAAIARRVLAGGGRTGPTARTDQGIRTTARRMPGRPASPNSRPSWPTRGTG